MYVTFSPIIRHTIAVNMNIEVITFNLKYFFTKKQYDAANRVIGTIPNIDMTIHILFVLSTTVYPKIDWAIIGKLSSTKVIPFPNKGFIIKILKFTITEDNLAFNDGLEYEPNIFPNTDP